MRAEFERLGRKQLEANLEQLVKSKVPRSAPQASPPRTALTQRLTGRFDLHRGCESAVPRRRRARTARRPTRAVVRAALGHGHDPAALPQALLYRTPLALSLSKHL